MTLLGCPCMAEANAGSSLIQERVSVHHPCVTKNITETIVLDKAHVRKSNWNSWLLGLAAIGGHVRLWVKLIDQRAYEMQARVAGPGCSHHWRGLFCYGHNHGAHRLYFHQTGLRAPLSSLTGLWDFFMSEKFLIGNIYATWVFDLCLIAIRVIIGSM